MRYAACLLGARGLGAATLDVGSAITDVALVAGSPSIQPGGDAGNRAVRLSFQFTPSADIVNPTLELKDADGNAWFSASASAISPALDSDTFASGSVFTVVWVVGASFGNSLSEGSYGHQLDGVMGGLSISDDDNDEELRTGLLSSILIGIDQPDGTEAHGGFDGCEIKLARLSNTFLAAANREDTLFRFQRCDGGRRLWGGRTRFRTLP